MNSSLLYSKVLRWLCKEQYLKTTLDSSRLFQNRPIARSLLNRLVNIWTAAPNYLRHAGAHNLERAASSSSALHLLQKK